MGIRIQPKDICVPDKGDPFENDLLSRKDTAEILTNLVGSIEGPCVLAVDAEWGNGKSTFLRLWSQHLRNNNNPFPIVELNAWTTDYTQDPFAVLSVELTDGLEQHADKAVVDSVVKGTIEVGRMLTPGLFRLALSGVPGGELLGSGIGKLIESYGETRFSAYREAKDSVQGFRESLETMAKTVSERHSNKPVMIMIDELDRCRPSYAIEFLEVAKHLFSVDRIIFVLAINRSELSHSVKSLYGQDFDANGYLKRFIDIDFMLPSPNRKQFISSSLKQTNIEEYIQKTQDNEAKRNGLPLIENLMDEYWETSVSLRQISQAIHRIGLVLASLPTDKKGLLEDTVIALILRTMHEDLYHRFRAGRATDLEIVNAIFPGKENSTLLGEYGRSHLEVAIILGYQKISEKPSALLEEYQNTIAYEEPDNDTAKKYWSHAKQVFDQLRSTHTQWTHRSGFEFAIHRIELFSNELKGEDDS